MHPRLLIRKAIAKLIENTEPSLQGHVFANRMEHWLQAELPAIGVYTLSESPIENNVSPYYEERSLNVVIEILLSASDEVDDLLDLYAEFIEQTIKMDDIGKLMLEIANKILLKSKKETILNIDCLLKLDLTKTELGIAVDAERQLGVASLNYTLEYRMPDNLPELKNLDLAHTNWDVEKADNNIDMQSEVNFEELI